MPGKYGSLNLDETGDDEIETRPGKSYFEALKENSIRQGEEANASVSASASAREDLSVQSGVLEDIPLPLKLAPLLKRLTDRNPDDDLSDKDILSILFIIRIADAMHRCVHISCVERV